MTTQAQATSDDPARVSTRGFSLEAYAALVQAILAQGYHLQGFDTAVADQRHLLLRHDVDVCPKRALRMAEHEAARGWKATYFVLVRSALYALFEDSNLAAVQRIRDLGHTVGLHLDASLYAPDALEAAAARECETLERWLGAPVSIISFHRPAKALLGNAQALAGRDHAYMPRFFNAMGYCSDSRGGWYHGQPLAHPALMQGRALQLLTHPIWWDADETATAREKIDALVEEHNAAYAAAIAEQITLVAGDE